MAPAVCRMPVMLRAPHPSTSRASRAVSARRTTRSIRCSADVAAAQPQQMAPAVLRVSGAVAAWFSTMSGRMQKLNALAAQASVDGFSLKQRMKLGHAAVPLFAAVTANSTLPLITSAVASFIKLYLLLLFVRVLLTWFPNVDWMGQPWVTLRQVTDPYLNLFRNLIPPLMGQIDFTPIFGFMVLQFLQSVLATEDPYAY